MRWPSPRAQTAQPERWRMRRWSREPRRMSVVEGREAASLARAGRVLSVCFIYIHETPDRGFVSRVFQTFLQDFVFFDFVPQRRARRPHLLERMTLACPFRVACSSAFEQLLFLNKGQTRLRQNHPGYNP